LIFYFVLRVAWFQVLLLQKRLLYFVFSFLFHYNLRKVRNQLNIFKQSVGLGCAGQNPMQIHIPHRSHFTKKREEKQFRQIFDSWALTELL
jgi:hypothetical protein